MNELITLIKNKDLIGLPESYMYDWNYFLNFLDEKGLGMNEESLKKYEKHLKENDYKVHNYNKKICSMKAGIRKMFEQTTASFDLNMKFKLEKVLNQIKLIKISTRKIDENSLPTEEEVKKLINKAHKNISLFIEFLYHQGVRVSEMLDIKLSDIKKSKECYIIPIIGKGRKARTLKVKKELINRIIEYFESEEWLFENLHYNKFSRRYVSWQIHLLGLKVLKKRISAHTMRHAFATHLKNRGVSIKAISKYLGHSSTAITWDMYIEDSIEFNELPLS